MFTVTRRWLDANRTKKGGWNMAQINILGTKWPPEEGWMKAVCGKEISIEDKLKFEELKNLK